VLTVEGMYESAQLLLEKNINECNEDQWNEILIHYLNMINPAKRVDLQGQSFTILLLMFSLSDNDFRKQYIETTILILKLLHRISKDFRILKDLVQIRSKSLAT